jgi:DNA end-binding protein Ku
MLQPWGKGIVLWTLRYGDEVRDSKDYWENIETERIDPKLMSMVDKLIDGKTKPWDPAMTTDPVQKSLMKIIAAKKKSGKADPKTVKHKTPPEKGNVVSIFDALRKSVEKEKRSTKR